jgi:hypothetical protein
MFEVGRWDEAVDGPEPVPPPLGPVEPWEVCDDGSWLEELAAADPERPRTVAEILHDIEHGLIDAALQAELAAIDVNGLSDDEQLAVAVAADRCVNHYEGVKLRAVGAFAGPVPRDDRCEGAFAWNEISGALALGEGQARTLTHTGRRLRTHLRGTLAGMLAGDVSATKAQSLVHATDLLDADQCAQVEGIVLPHAATRNSGNHTAAVGRAVRKVDPDGWKDRREQKLRDVAMIRFSHGDGVADTLLRSLDSYEAELLWTAATTWARTQKAAGDLRTLDALRVAAVLDWSARYLTGTPIGPDAGAEPTTTPTTAPAPTRHGQPAVVNVIIHLPDLIDPAHGGAATVAGSGDPLPADAVADLLGDGARIRFALVDNDGNLAGMSTRLHDPTALMRAFVTLRDVTLRVPGGSCTVVAGQDLDHINPDGPTQPANLHPPSRGWHRAKTFGHWTLSTNPDHTITWTSRRTGRSYTTRPYNHRDDP